jgi:hypothetical protein
MQVIGSAHIMAVWWALLAAVYASCFVCASSAPVPTVVYLAARTMPVVLSPLSDAMVEPVTTDLMCFYTPKDINTTIAQTLSVRLVGSWQELGCCSAFGDVLLMEQLRPLTNTSVAPPPRLVASSRASHKDHPWGEPHDFAYTENYVVRLTPGSIIDLQTKVFQGYFPTLRANVSLAYIPRVSNRRR